MQSPTMPSMWPTMLPPLLSPHSIADFTADSFASYVRSLYEERKSGRKALPGRARVPKATFKRNKKGTLILTTRRQPLKWLTSAEFTLACAEHKVSQQELWLYLSEREVVIVKDVAEGLALCQQVAEIPW